MGRVFEVEHVRIGRRAAMKIVQGGSAVRVLAKRLLAEAEAVNAIGNPHVVEITDILEPPGGNPALALVMELLEGTVLADLIRQGPPPLARALPIMAQICDALAAVHAAGFVHRDLKPENVVLITRDANPDFVKLLDFGLVKALGTNLRSPTATVEGTFLGSPAYASPEQAEGKRVDWRTDIYAVGVMLYEVITGRLPFEAPSIREVLIKHINQPAPRLPDHLLDTEIGRALDAVIQTCLSKSADDRHLSAEQLASRLRALTPGTSLTTNVVREAAAGARQRRRERRLSVLLPIAAVCGLALFIAAHPKAAKPSPDAGDGALSTPDPVPSLPPVPQRVSWTLPDRTPEEHPASPRVEPEVVSTPRSARRGMRAPERLDKAVTLDPYR